jgi:hypothetical protein
MIGISKQSRQGKNFNELAENFERSTFSSNQSQCDTKVNYFLDSQSDHLRLETPGRRSPRLSAGEH